jgi:hypothetical protein
MGLLGPASWAGNRIIGAMSAAFGGKADTLGRPPINPPLDVAGFLFRRRYARWEGLAVASIDTLHPSTETAVLELVT